MANILVSILFIRGRFAVSSPTHHPTRTCGSYKRHRTFAINVVIWTRQSSASTIITSPHRKTA